MRAMIVWLYSLLNFLSFYSFFSIRLVTIRKTNQNRIKIFYSKHGTSCEYWRINSWTRLSCDNSHCRKRSCNSFSTSNTPLKFLACSWNIRNVCFLVSEIRISPRVDGRACDGAWGYWRKWPVARSNIFDLISDKIYINWDFCRLSSWSKCL